MTVKFKEAIIGRCLRQFSHPLYESLIKECDGFIVLNHQTSVPEGAILDTPRCGPNQYCYGILKDSGVRVLLRYIVDSSD